MKSVRQITTFAAVVAIAASFLLAPVALSDDGDAATDEGLETSACPYGMLNYWRFDEGTGAVAFDSVGIFHGDVFGAQWTAGQVNHALSFGGVSDFVQVPESPEWVFYSFSLELWIRTADSHVQQGTIVRTYGSSWGTAGFGIGIGGSGAREGHLTEVSYRPEPGGPKAEMNSLAAGVRVDDDEWHLVTLVRDYDIGKAFLYVDRMIVCEADDVGGPIDIPRDMLIGNSLYQGKYYPFFGAIDEVAVYNRALSLDEIERHYTNGLSGKGYCYVPPDEAIESLIADIEGMGLHRGTENSLVAKLENALKSLEKGHDEAAVHKLQVFVNAVEARRGKKLTEEQADQLINAAELIVETILEDLE